MKAWVLVGLVACGDNRIEIGEPLQPSELLFVAAHVDDDEIFMQPELRDALLPDHDESVTTVFVATGDPVLGGKHALMEIDSAMFAYGAIADSQDWDCGYITIAGSPARHCRLRDRPVSIVALDLPDGGIPGTRSPSLLELFNGTDATMPILGPLGGTATVSSIVDEMAEIIADTQPAQIHTLELAGTHGRDHSSHMFASAFTWWGAAKLGYAGPITWHRGYNVETEAPTLDESSRQAAAFMVGYYEACADKCAPCGEICIPISTAHENWLERQYAVTRIFPTTLELTDGNYRLEKNHLTLDGQCLASTPDGGTSLTDCTSDPAQAWVVDSEGSLWNGAVPQPTTDDMSFDHVRCLTTTGTPVCGSRLSAQWQFQ